MHPRLGTSRLASRVADSHSVGASGTVLVSCLSSIAGPVSDRACFPGPPHELLRHLLLKGRPWLVRPLALTSSSVAVIPAPLPPSAKPQRDPAGYTVVRQSLMPG